MSPGGSLEETGFTVKAVKPFVTVNEYCYDTLYISHYFLCEIIGTGEGSLTETESDKGMLPQWVDIKKALDIFSEHEKQTPDKSKHLLKEFTVLNKYISNQ